jgi:hypothetical protein
MGVAYDYVTGFNVAVYFGRPIRKKQSPPQVVMPLLIVISVLLLTAGTYTGVFRAEALKHTASVANTFKIAPGSLRPNP